MLRISFLTTPIIYIVFQHAIPYQNESMSKRPSSASRFSRFKSHGSNDIPLEDIPILEDDDEDRVLAQPVLPTFHTESAKVAPTEIEQDFDQEFVKDTEQTGPKLPKGRRQLEDSSDEPSSDDISTDEEVSPDSEPERPEGLLQRIKTTLSKHEDTLEEKPHLLHRFLGISGGAGTMTPGAQQVRDRPPDEETPDMDQARFIVNRMFKDEGAPSSGGSSHEMSLLDRTRFDSFDDLNRDSEWEIDVPESLMNKPRKVRRGVASSLLSLYNRPKHEEVVSDSDSELAVAPKSQRGTGSKKLIPSTEGSSDSQTPVSSIKLPSFKDKSKAGDPEYEDMQRRHKKTVHRENTARVTVHIAGVLQRQKFILTLCKGFMKYGAPTHRLEEYMVMTARVLEIDGSFIYFPGCMLVSFSDATTHTTETRLVRCPEGLDLGKLDEVHDIYKDVVHDRLGVQDATDQLEAIMKRSPHFKAIFCILMYAFCSAMVAPWAFGGSWLDLPICFSVGLVIGTLQFVICPRSPLYSSLFEVSASIISSFMARAIGSVRGGDLFCYAAIVQSSLALILPGYIILCGSLELQSRNIVAGAVRMFYAFIYALMLSFGITLGAALYGWIDPSATSVTKCTSDISPWFYFLFVPGFTMGIALCNQASWRQLPIMVFVSGSGYVVAYFSGKHFKNQSEVNATLGCFIVGLTSNGYSRLMKSLSKFITKGYPMTASIMLPAIFVQVPSGIASQGSVMIGMSTANELVSANATSTSSEENSISSIAFGLLMIEVALGISVGLYLSTVIVYPLGKKRTGLFTL